VAAQAAVTLSLPAAREILSLALELSRMQPPMIGNWSVEVREVRSYTIHGDLYHQLHVILLDGAAGDADETLHVIRLPQHAIQGTPQGGDRLSLTFLMGQVTAARPME
jgi:hypothetical protein